MKGKTAGAKYLETNSDINLNCFIERSMKDEMENLALAPDGLIRLREHLSDSSTKSTTIVRNDRPYVDLSSSSVSSTPSTCITNTNNNISTNELSTTNSQNQQQYSHEQQQQQQQSDIAKFPQDSLHSFRFSSTTSTDLVALRKRVMTRSIDFMKHSTQGGWKAPETLPGHYSSASLLASMEKRRNKTKSMGYPHSSASITHIQPLHQQRKRRNSLPGIGEDSPSMASPSSRTLSSSSSTSTSTMDTSTTGATTPAPDQSPSMMKSRTNKGNGNDLEDNDDHNCKDDGDDNDNDADDDDGLDHQLPSLALFPHPALHNPTRFLPQNQAILTTYDDWRIILSNNIASFVLVGGGGTNGSSIVGKSVLDYVDISFRSRLQAMIKKRRQELSHLEDSAGGMVLVCGNVLPIVKDDGTKSAASLWLKEKRNDSGSSVYIWIFEEVFETVTHVSIDAKGLICYVDQGIQELLDYVPESLMGKPINTLIPSLTPGDGNNINNNNYDNNDYSSWQELYQHKYFGCRTRLGAHLPIITKLLDAATNETPSAEPTTPQQCYTIRITSIPMIAGLVTVRQDGIIDGCNDVFVKYMFGYSQEELAGKKSIADILPQFPSLLQCLRRDDLLQHGIIINNLICRKLIADIESSTTTASQDTLLFQQQETKKRLTQTPHGQSLPVLLGIHRDGTKLEIQLQLKLVEESDDGICALWITFDRDSTLSRVGHKIGGPALEIKQHNGLGLPTAKRDELLASNEEFSDDDNDDHLEDIDSLISCTTTYLSNQENGATKLLENTLQSSQQKAQPIHIPMKNGNSNHFSSSANSFIATTTTTTTCRATTNATGITDTNTSTTTTVTTTTTTTAHDNMENNCSGSLSVSRPSCDTNSPRVITSFSRPTFSTYNQEGQHQQQHGPSPTSPGPPYSPSSYTYNNRPRAFSTASVTMPEYSAQTHATCIDDYEILDEIGQGAYGLVKLAVRKQDESQKKVVIKYVIKSRILVDCWTRDRKLGMVPAEIHILHTLRKIPHDNCGDMMDYFEDDDYYYIIMELHGAGMDLFDYIELKETMRESEIRSIFKQIALAVRHLHTHKIVHRDIKDENVVLDQNGGIRLIDFGSAAYVRPGRRYETFVGTLDYAAPEILRGQTYDGPPQDVWALGILLYTLVYRENPFYDIDEIMARELRVPFVFSDGLSVDLIKKMLERDVTKRLTVHQVLEHPWLASSTDS